MEKAGENARRPADMYVGGWPKLGSGGGHNSHFVAEM
jgi:hypothetical protein